MMNNLLELIKYRNSLQLIQKEFDLMPSIEPKFELLRPIRSQGLYQFENDKIHDELNSIVEKNTLIKESVVSHINQVTHDITQLANSLFDNNIYQKQHSEENIHRYMTIDPAVENHFTGKISGYSNLRYPSLQINPRSRKLVDYMVSSDPLYLTSHDADYSKSTLNEIVQSYPEAYQRRLRCYQTADRTFDMLPKASFGFVLCWDTFNYLSIEKIETYLREVYRLLKPGGVFMFSYNNCDIEDSALWATDVATDSEMPSISYVTARNLESIVNMIGYGIISKHDVPVEAAMPYVSWMEIRKPGTLSTVKVHQALARIEHK